jgi:NitT/TauT family transport system substrate-binding protein
MRLRQATYSLLAAVLAVAVGGCASQAPSPDTGLEKTSLRVGTLPVVDAAALYIAKEQGLFADEGLKVEVETIQGGAFAIPKLISGSLDVSMLNYVSAVTAQSKKAAELKIIADAYQAKPGTFMLLAGKDSPVKDAADLRGRRVAVVSLAGIATLAVETQLRAAGIGLDAVRFVTMPLPDMAAALKRGSVDAALLSEPFITQAQTVIGARAVADGMSGAMADFPVAGWGCSAKWAAGYPRMMAAFTRAMSRAQQIAAGDRKAVERVLARFLKMAPEVATTVALGSYPLRLSLARLQRVPDLMAEYGYIPDGFDMSVMLLPGVASVPASASHGGVQS